MNDSNTEAKEKSRTQEELRQLLLMTKLLEDAGIRVIGTSTSCGTVPPSVLFSDGFAKFREWTNRLHLEVHTERSETSVLPWMIWTEYHGIEIHTFMSDQEKERFDAAEEA